MNWKWRKGVAEPGGLVADDILPVEFIPNITKPLRPGLHMVHEFHVLSHDDAGVVVPTTIERFAQTVVQSINKLFDLGWRHGLLIAIDPNEIFDFVKQSIQTIRATKNN